jgi:hypothetical protein
MEWWVPAQAPSTRVSDDSTLNGRSGSKLTSNQNQRLGGHCERGHAFASSAARPVVRLPGLAAHAGSSSHLASQTVCRGPKETPVADRATRSAHPRMAARFNDLKQSLANANMLAVCLHSDRRPPSSAAAVCCAGIAGVDLRLNGSWPAFSAKCSITSHPALARQCTDTESKSCKYRNRLVPSCPRATSTLSWEIRDRSRGDVFVGRGIPTDYRKHVEDCKDTGKEARKGRPGVAMSRSKDRGWK